MKLSFHGAAKMVTGSCHLLDTGHRKILLDCGLFQGSQEEEKMNNEPFKFDPASIDYLFLSHAHLDHCGRIPLLVKQGFNGKIICTRATRDLTRLILMDAAKLQNEDFERAIGRGLKGEELEERKPLYDAEDVYQALGMMETYNYSDSIKVDDSLEFRLRDAGHILGSAIIELWVKNSDQRQRKIVFSGDLGHRGQRLVKDTDMVSEADYVIVESTYGTRYHKSRDETVLEFLGIIREAQSRKGNIIIPSFAVERAQEIIYELNLFKRNNLVDGLSIYLDSPMAIEATEIFKRYAEDFDEDAERILDGGDNPIAFDGLHYVKDIRESRSLTDKSGIIIIAGNGMATGGRIVDHLIVNLPRPTSHIVFVGFQVPGTNGRKIIDGESPIRLYGKEVDIQAKVHTLGGFSAHADQRDLRYWLRSFGKTPQKVFMVHGDPETCQGFSENIRQELGQNTYIPNLFEEVELV